MNSFGIGMGLEAVNSYYKADDARVLREQERQRFAQDQDRYGWEKQRNEAGLGLLPDEIAARRAGYQNSTATDLGNLSLVKGNVANAAAQQGVTKTSLANQAALQPKQQERAMSDADLATIMSQGSLSEGKTILERAKLAGYINDQQMGRTALGFLGTHIANYDTAGAVSYANQLSDFSKSLPGSAGGFKTSMKFVDMIPEEGFTAQTIGQKGYSLIAENGHKVWLPATGIDNAVRMMSQGKTTVTHDNNGNFYKNNEATGVGEWIKGAPNASGQRGLHQNSPADITSAQWLMDNRVAKDANEAWSIVRAAREQTRPAFVRAFIMKNPTMTSDMNKLRQQAEEAYDRSQPQNGAASNTPRPSTVDPSVWDAAGLQPPTQ